MPHADPEKRKQYQRDHYRKNRKKILKRRAKYVETHREEVSSYMRDYFQSHKVEFCDAASRSRLKLKLQVIEKLGGKCACCGETEPEFLTVDHVNGGGNAHRRSLRESGKAVSLGVYRIVRDAKDAGMYRLLCWNCNSSSHFGDGICAHKRTQQRAA